MGIGFFTSQDMPRWPRISINSLEEQYFIGHLLQAGRNGNFDGIPKICYWWTPLVGGFKGSKDGDPLRSAAVRSLPALCAGWQHICTVATMFVLDCCHRLSWGILILVGTWECLVPLVPEGLSKVAEFLKTSSLWMFFLSLDSFRAKDESHWTSKNFLFSSDSFEALGWDEKGTCRTAEAAFTCNLPHCDNHVALLLCGLHDIPSVLDLETRGRASLGHRFGLCSCEGDSSMTATSPVPCDKARLARRGASWYKRLPNVTYTGWIRVVLWRRCIIHGLVIATSQNCVA